MFHLRAFFGRRTLWLGFSAAFLPLLLLLGLQYSWLIELQRASSLAGQAMLDNFLEAIATEILYTYGPAAERVLDVPSSYFAEERLARVAGHFRKLEPDGVKALFVARFDRADDAGTLLFYDPRTDSIAPPAPSAASRAVVVACAPWKLMKDNAIEVDSVRLVVEERDPDNRIVLNPIRDAASRVVGVAGMILDEEQFAREVLPGAIRAARPKFFSGQSADRVTVTVRDGRNAVRYASDPDSTDDAADAVGPFTFVFTDWRIAVSRQGRTPAQWARAGFVFNLTLAALAGVLLTGGLLLALRTASREFKLSQMKSDFVSNVSHELRTPLASIRVFGELLRLGRTAAAPEKVREYGEYIETESRRLTQLIDNILDFSRIEAGRKSYRFAAGDVGQVLSATLEALAVRLRHGGFTLEYEKPDRPLPPARIDADALGRALHNLLDNAINYSGSSRWIGVRLASAPGEIVVSVRDRGLGIPADEHERIFDRFHRVGRGLIHDVRGSGLGLAIVRHIVAAHRGTVTVDSAPGHGSVFHVRLPVAQPEPATGAEGVAACPGC